VPDFFIDPQRVIERQHVDQRSQPEALRALDRRSNENARARRHAERRRVVLRQVIREISFSLHQYDEAEPVFIERGERPAVAVQMVENSEFEQMKPPIWASLPSAHRAALLVGPMGYGNRAANALN
jgi:hypothetical protein